MNTRADTRIYSANFWIEQLENGKLQMQYSEIANIFFHKKGTSKSADIDWPHVMVNTLTDNSSNTSRYNNSASIN